MTIVTSSAVVDRAGVDAWLTPRDDLVKERARGHGRFEAEDGPVESYRRTVVVEHLPDGRSQVTSTTEFSLAVPYFGFLFVLPFRRVLGRRPRTDGRQPWWAPPDRLDARAASALGLLSAASMVTGYLGTLITQTITFAADDFGLTDDRPQGYSLAVVRLGVLLALVLLGVADRRGRRRMLLASAVGGILLAATTAAAPSLVWFTATQTGARAFSTALALLVGIVAAEEMPRGARAYAVSLLGMAGAFGAGVCVMALPLADLDERAWRLLFLLPLLALPLVADLARRLPESRRFGTPHTDVGFTGHGRRLALLAGAALLLALFTTPASQFQNEFLRDERGFSAARISLFTILTNTPGGIGVVVGGRLADVRGRRIVGAIGVVGGVGATVVMYLVAGWPLWAWSVIGAIVGGATIPALGVYGPELFPTSLRGRANGLIGLLAVVGSSVGLLLAGVLSDRLGGLGPALAVLSVGPALLVVLVLVAFPETAHRELEELNPEDEPPDRVPQGQPR